jgi:hypothetical protein
MALNTFGTYRDQLAFTGLTAAERQNEVDDLIGRQVLVGDPRRWRPRWFDGRFLAASDLQAEQNYFLIRQADLGRAGGSGVIEGLLVSEATEGGLERLRITAGSGVTDNGELIVLPEALLVDPANVPQLQRLDAAFGLQVIPNEPGRTRTGLYILALRPVEWTANPVGAYPTSLTGARTVQDGTIIEGLAVSLIPYPDTGQEETWQRRRARVAREIFVEGRDRGFDSGVLPLAMVALRGNFIEWVDPFLVRRETGAERPAGMDFGFGARALREAHLLQYQRHFADALDLQSGKSFLASEHFDVLPPVGQLPAAAIDPDRLTQRFFPAGIEVDLSFLPEDELPALIEESLLLPPLDLTAGFEALSGTGVIVLVPLTRAVFLANRGSLPNWDAELPRLRAGFDEMKAASTPKELLIRQFQQPAAEPAPGSEEAAWRDLLRQAIDNAATPSPTESPFWFVRRRHLPIASNVAGTPVDASPDAVANPIMLARLTEEDDELAENFRVLGRVDAPEVNSLMRRLSERRFLDNPALLKSVVSRAAGDKGKPPRPEDAIVALAVTADPKLGEGLARIERENPKLATSLAKEPMSRTGSLAEVDKLARKVPEKEFEDFTKELTKVIRTRDKLPAGLAGLRTKHIPTGTKHVPTKTKRVSTRTKHVPKP